MSKKKSLHIGVEDKEYGIHQDKDHKKDAFDYGAFAADDLEEDTSLVSVVRCILTAPKIEKEN